MGATLSILSIVALSSLNNAVFAMGGTYPFSTYPFRTGDVLR